MRQIIQSIAILFSVVFAGVSVSAQQFSFNDSHSRIEFYSEVSSVKPGEEFWLAVRYAPRENWHTYWQNPGDSGAAPLYDWKLDAEIEIGEAIFPVPRPLPVGPLMNYGYDGAAVHLIPVTMTTSDAETVTLKGEVEWLVCEIECVPQFTTFEFTLPVGAGELDPAVGAIFAEARLNTPDPAYWDSAYEFDGDSATLTVFMDTGEVGDVREAYFYPRAEGVLTYAAPQTVQTVQADGASGLVLGLERWQGAQAPDHANGVLTIGYKNGKTEAFDLTPDYKQATAKTTATPVPAGAAERTISFWQAALYAFVGGLILNLMPCVFPILSLKAFAFIKTGDHTPGQRRAEGWFYTAGIVVSFLAIGIALLGLREAGLAVGWGFQLQEPAFVGAMTLVMVLIGASLLGLFNIQTGLESTGQELTMQAGYRGSFFTGVLATLVATPCTAPLMAPALGFALTQPSIIIFTVLIAMALGLALPFLILSHSQAIARRLPRPGAWMEKVKQGMAFPMFLTAAWLLYVFVQQSDSASVFLLLGAIIGVIFSIWLWHQGTGRILKTVSIVLGLAFAAVIVIPQPDEDISGSPVEITAFSQQKLGTLLDAGEPVFAYFTADWCITCKVNERVALFREETMTLFENRGIHLLKGDWTNRNKEVAALLAQYGRAGVPMYLYFPPGSKEAILLPEVLTVGIIRETIEGEG